MKENLSLRKVVVQWILVRTFGYAVRLLHSLDRRMVSSEDYAMVRMVCVGLERQIVNLSYPRLRIESPTGKRFDNEWP